jgi:Polysaccharide lyase
MTTNRSRPLGRGISRQTFVRGGVAMLATGAVFGTTRAVVDTVGGFGGIAGLSDLTGVFLPAWTSPAVANAHFNTMSTPYGPGLTFTCADTDIATWDSRDKAILAQHRPETIGTEVQWTFYLNLPPQTFLSDWFCGLLWEFHTNTSSGHNLSIDVTETPQPCFKIMRDIGGGATPYYTSALTFNHWYQVIVQVKWSLGSDGYIRWIIDGRNWLDYSGATCFPGGGDPYLQFGYYSSTGAGTNYSQFGGITKRPSSNS